MPANPTETTAAPTPARSARRQPLVSPDLVRRWAARAGLPVVPEGPLDEATVDLYLYWHRRRRDASDSTERQRARPTTAQRAVPAVSPALLEAVSCAYRPEPCPSCGRPTYLTYVDLSRLIQRQQCDPCGRRWMSAIPPAP